MLKYLIYSLFIAGIAWAAMDSVSGVIEQHHIKTMETIESMG